VGLQAQLPLRVGAAKFHREFGIAGAVRPVRRSMAAPTLALPRMRGREGEGAFCCHIPTLHEGFPAAAA